MIFKLKFMANNFNVKILKYVYFIKQICKKKVSFKLK